MLLVRVRVDYMLNQLSSKELEWPQKIQLSGLWWLWLTGIAVLLDQVTKLWVIEQIPYASRIVILPFFNLTHVHNYGAAFSFLSDAGGWQRIFLTVIAVMISMLLLWWMRQTPKTNIVLSISYALILGGAIGNVIDRVAYGYVVDFLHFYYQTWHFPAFNVADSAICLGAFLLLYDAFTSKEPSDVAGAENSSDGSDDSNKSGEQK